MECDAEGFILQASHGIEHLNEPLPAFLIPPRLYDLVAPEHVGLVKAELALVASGNDSRGWTEFLLAAEGRAGRWFALRLTPAPDGKGRVLGIMRDVHERRMLEDKLFAARLTDPLTGLTNRIAFDDMLRYVAENRVAGCLGLFGIDHFRAINHRLGHDFGDDVLKGFAEVLRTVMRTGDTLSRIGDAQFAVLFLGIDHGKASDLARQAQEVFADELPCGKDMLPLSATVGIAELGDNAHETLRRAEMAIVLGKASAPGKVALEHRPRALKQPVITRAGNVQDALLRRAG